MCQYAADAQDKHWLAERQHMRATGGKMVRSCPRHSFICQKYSYLRSFCVSDACDRSVMLCLNIFQAYLLIEEDVQDLAQSDDYR